MYKTDVPQEEWKSFFANFSERNKERMAYIEVTDDEHYRLDYSESIAFYAINISEIDNEHITIVISAGENSSFKKYVDRTERIILGSQNGTDKELHVISSLGRGAIIKFHEL